MAAFLIQWAYSSSSHILLMYIPADIFAKKLCNRNIIGQCVSMEIIRMKINTLLKKIAIILV